MKHFTTTSLMIVLVAIALLLAVSIALAQNGDYDLSWFTVDGGGGSVSNGGSGYTLMGTAGQPDAGELFNGSYTLSGGFWQGEAAAAEEHIKIYLPLILKNCR
jgi:hypothetical protein